MNTKRVKHPNIYSFRTSRRLLSALDVISSKTGIFKCDIIELAIKEYIVKYFPNEGIRL